MDDAFFTTSPLATVQLIPVINYLNLLSDFLFIENYLAEVNQNKQIPIVNALYEYFDENRDISKKVKLVRSLLRDSDLYGAQDSEEVDIVFVSAMFDYIISSLVFDKYGNIYGFLAEVVQRTANLQHNHVLIVVKETLRNATFENEYGANSVLTHLAVDRIFKDIILPLFPQPCSNLSLLSLDYIFAQAGSMYLRLGKINDTYFSGSKNSHYMEIFNSAENDTETFFHDYLSIGHVIRKLIHSGKIDPLNLRVFALPALFYYVSNRVTYDSITNVIFSPHHWKTAYYHLFEYLDTVFDQIENQLTQDYTYKIHLAFSHFQSLGTMANFILQLKCRFLHNNCRETNKEPEPELECNRGFALPIIKDWYQEQIHNFGEIYGKYHLKRTQQLWRKFSIKDLSGVRITLLFTKDRVLNTSNSNSSESLSYDLFEFYYTEDKTFDFYALIRDGNRVSLIKESDDPQFFQKRINISVDELIQSAHRRILKSANATEELFEEFMQERFDLNVRFSDENLKRNEWWQKFGLSLVPPYPSLLKIPNDETIKIKLCERNTIQILNQLQEPIFPQLIHKYIQSLFSSLGTTIKTIFLKDSISTIVETLENIFLWPQLVNTPGSINPQNLDTVFDSFSLEIEKPAFVSSSTTLNDIKFVAAVVDDLEEKVNSNFTSSVKNTLNQMQILKIPYMKPLYNKEKKKNMFVYAWINNTGYGYKFAMVDTFNGTITFAQLRTDYEFKKEILITPSEINFSTKSLNDGKTYVKLNNATFEIEPYYIYEINNQLRKKSTRLRFYGISVYYQNSDNCDNQEYIKDKEHINSCLRHIRFVEKTTIQEEEAVKLLRKKGILSRKDFSYETHARNVLRNYTFPNQAMFLYFIENWISDNSFEKSDWSSKNIIDKSGLLRKLMYDVHLGKCNLSLSDGKSEIDSIYTYRERKTIEDGTSLENIIQDYNEQRACYSVTFEDYYAIRNFATTGDRRISGDTTEAKLMKIALYKLAVRQFEDLGEGFELKLFRFETKPVDIVVREFYQGKRVVLQKFTLTSPSEESAMRFAGYPTAEFENVLYEFKFNGPYFRAKIEAKVERFESIREKQIILLPGSEFTITDILTTMNIGGYGNATKVVLTSRFNDNEKYEWYKKIMTKITRIKL